MALVRPAVFTIDDADFSILVEIVAVDDLAGREALDLLDTDDGVMLQYEPLRSRACALLDVGV